MALGAYSSYWRTLRRICTVELFSNKIINETVLIRQKCVDEMLLWIEKEAEKGANDGIEVLKFVFPAAFNLIGNLTVSCDLVDPYSKMASEFQTALSGVSECLGHPNISDLFPWIRWLDRQGLRTRTERELGKAMQIISGFVNERAKQRNASAVSSHASLILGSLLHHFDWKFIENDSGEIKIDMRETMGLAAKKLEPLKAVPKRLTR